MPARKDISAIKGAIVSVATEIKEKGGQPEKVAALATLVGALGRLLRIYNSRRKSGGDPLYHDMMKD